MTDLWGKLCFIFVHSQDLRKTTSLDFFRKASSCLISAVSGCAAVLENGCQPYKPGDPGYVTGNS